MSVRWVTSGYTRPRAACSPYRPPDAARARPAIVLNLAAFVMAPDRSSPGSRDAVASLAALCLYSLSYGLFFLPSFLTGNYIAPSDSLDFGVAAYLSPPAIWTQGMFSGHPIAADPQGVTLYPVLHVFRSAGADWNLFLTAAYVIASTTCFMLVHRLTRSPLAAVFSGFVFGFNGLMLGYITNFNQIHAVAWVPLVLYGLQLIREHRHRAGAAVAAAGVALMWVAGHPQAPVYATYLAAAFVVGSLLVDRPDRVEVRSRATWSAGALGLGVMLAAILLVPMLEFGRLSPRAEASWDLYGSSALPPVELLTLIVPFAFGGFWTPSGGVPYVGETLDTAYVGLVPLALVLGAAFVARKRANFWLWMVLAASQLLLALGPATPLGMLFFWAPGYASFQAPLRHLFLASLGVAVVSGIAIAELSTRRDRIRIVAAAGVGVALAAASAFGAFAWTTPAVQDLMDSHADYAWWAAVWPAALAGAVLPATLGMSRLARTGGRPVAFGVLLIGLHLADLTLFHYRLPGRQFRYADVSRLESTLHPRMAALRDELKRTGQRVLATDGSQNPFLLPNLTRAWDVPSAAGTGALAIQRYVELMGMATSGHVPAETLAQTQHRGADLFAIRYALVPRDSDRARAVEGQTDRWQPIENLVYYESDPGTYYTLYRNLRARPRAWCVPEVVQVAPDAALAAIRAGRFADGAAFDPARTALVDPDMLDGWRRTEEDPDAKVVRLSGRNDSYQVTSKASCLLVLSEVHYPWWRASVDGRKAELIRVNHAMVGLVVPAGSHLVRLWHAPVSVWAGAALSGAGLVLWSLLVVPVRFSIRRWKDQPDALVVEKP